MIIIPNNIVPTKVKVSESKYYGCLFGLAIGDALGAPVEFLSLQQIKRKFGSTGIKDLHHWSDFPAGSFTDDTQMALATAVGCIRAWQRWSDRGICNSAAVVYGRYLDWLTSQDDPFQRRAPGNTCISALESGVMGTMEKKINKSKGCGGVMRTAPVGLAWPQRGDDSIKMAFQHGAEFAAITHGHPSGYLPAGVLSALIASLKSGESIALSIDRSVEALVKYKGYKDTLQKINEAIRLAGEDISSEQAIKQLGEGWVGEEALAIAVYCSLKYPKNWKKGVLAAVNHSGDSDSTGSITGAILGTALGIEGIPSRWVKKVEDAEKIRKIAHDMYLSFQKGKVFSNKVYPPN